MYDEHHRKQLYGNTIKEIVDQGIVEKKSLKQIQKDVVSLCINCLLPPSQDCELCNGHYGQEIKRTVSEVY